jgi:hypothetical protein
MTERHIGIDQGTKNFAMVAVDKSVGSVPRVVGAELYDLRRPGLNENRVDVNTLILALNESTVLMNWMQQSGQGSMLPHVDRVIVHVEQISRKNKFGKQLGMEFGRALQRQVADLDACVVKMSQPHIHRATGPMFKLGSQIVQACNLKESATYSSCRNRRNVQAEDGPSTSASRAMPQAKTARRVESHDDVEPDSDVDEVDEEAELAVEMQDESGAQYRHKKRMSSDIFRYIIDADVAQQAEMQISVQAELQMQWREQIAKGLGRKLDDLGDALLHSLNEILCGSSNYRPLVPATPSLHVNRSIVLGCFQNFTYWIVLHCTWNLFTIENVGVYESRLAKNICFKSPVTVQRIAGGLEAALRQALTEPQQSTMYARVEHVKAIVKQIGEDVDSKLSRVAAGALTNSTVQAMTELFNEVAGDESLLSTCNSKEGWSYTRTIRSGCKYQVLRSGGKHTNAISSCMSWMRENAPLFVKDRLLCLSSKQKVSFFDSLSGLLPDERGQRQLEMVRVSENAAGRLLSGSFGEERTKRRLADLILIGLSINSQYISAIAPNYRKDTKTTGV